MVVEKIELYKGEEKVKSLDDLTTKEFTELLSNNTYELRLSYKYDLNDGTGNQTVTIKNSIKTLSNVEPKLSIVRSGDALIATPTLEYEQYTDSSYYLKSFGSSMDKVVILGGYYNNLPITYLDFHSLINCSWIEEAIILDTVTKMGGEVFYGTSLKKIVFQGVTPPSFDYNILGYQSPLVYVPDEAFETYKAIHDSLWMQNIVMKDNLRKISELTISPDEYFYGAYDSIVTKDTISFKSDIVDVDNVGTSYIADLYIGNNFVKSITLTSNNVSFDKLLSNTIYTVKLKYNYDLNDGTGSKELSHICIFKTLSYATPTITLKDLSSTKTSISFDYDVNDADSIGKISKIELYLDEQLIKSLEDLTVREFTGLQSGKKYTIKVTYSFDLKDGFDIQNAIDEEYVTTHYEEPEVLKVNNQDEYFSYLEEHYSDQKGENDWYNKPVLFECTYTVVTLSYLSGEDYDGTPYRQKGCGLIVKDENNNYLFLTRVDFTTDVFSWDEVNGYYSQNGAGDYDYKNKSTGFDSDSRTKDIKVGDKLTIIVMLSNSTFNGFTGGDIPRMSGKYGYSCFVSLNN